MQRSTYKELLIYRAWATCAKTRKNTGPYLFLNAYVSLRNNFADNMRSKKTVWLWGQEMERVPGYSEVFKLFIVRECFICKLEPSIASLSLPN